MALQTSVHNMYECIGAASAHLPYHMHMCMCEGDHAPQNLHSAHWERTFEHGHFRMGLGLMKER